MTIDYFGRPLLEGTANLPDDDSSSSVKYSKPGMEVPDDVVHINVSVSVIPDRAFSHKYALRSVILFNGVNIIGEEAFKGCTSLRTIIFPDRGCLISIGNDAFSLCESLKIIQLPDGLKKIGESAFEYCQSLATIELPDSVKEIGRYAFRNCGSLRSLKFPAGVKRVTESLFYGCQNLEVVLFPENGSIEEIEENVFSFCSSLTTVEIPSDAKIKGVVFHECDEINRKLKQEDLNSFMQRRFDGFPIHRLIYQRYSMASTEELLEELDQLYELDSNGMRDIDMFQLTPLYLLSMTSISSFSNKKIDDVAIINWFNERFNETVPPSSTMDSDITPIIMNGRDNEILKTDLIDGLSALLEDEGRLKRIMYEANVSYSPFASLEDIQALFERELETIMKKFKEVRKRYGRRRKKKKSRSVDVKREKSKRKRRSRKKSRKSLERKIERKKARMRLALGIKQKRILKNAGINIKPDASTQDIHHLFEKEVDHIMKEINDNIPVKKDKQLLTTTESESNITHALVHRKHVLKKENQTVDVESAAVNAIENIFNSSSQLRDVDISCESGKTDEEKTKTMNDGIINKNEANNEIMKVHDFINERGESRNFEITVNEDIIKIYNPILVTKEKMLISRAEKDISANKSIDTERIISKNESNEKENSDKLNILTEAGLNIKYYMPKIDLFDTTYSAKQTQPVGEPNRSTTIDQRIGEATEQKCVYRSRKDEFHGESSSNKIMKSLCNPPKNMSEKNLLLNTEKMEQPWLVSEIDQDMSLRRTTDEVTDEKSAIKYSNDTKSGNDLLLTMKSDSCFELDLSIIKDNEKPTEEATDEILEQRSVYSDESGSDLIQKILTTKLFMNGHCDFHDSIENHQLFLAPEQGILPAHKTDEILDQRSVSSNNGDNNEDDYDSISVTEKMSGSNLIQKIRTGSAFDKNMLQNVRYDSHDSMEHHQFFLGPEQGIFPAHINEEIFDQRSVSRKNGDDGKDVYGSVNFGEKVMEFELDIESDLPEKNVNNVLKGKEWIQYELALDQDVFLDMAIDEIIEQRSIGIEEADIMCESVVSEMAESELYATSNTMKHISRSPEMKQNISMHKPSDEIIEQKSVFKDVEHETDSCDDKDGIMSFELELDVNMPRRGSCNMSHSSILLSPSMEETLSVSETNQDLTDGNEITIDNYLDKTINSESVFEDGTKKNLCNASDTTELLTVSSSMEDTLSIFETRCNSTRRQTKEEIINWAAIPQVEKNQADTFNHLDEMSKVDANTMIAVENFNLSTHLKGNTCEMKKKPHTEKATNKMIHQMKNLRKHEVDNESNIYGGETSESCPEDSRPKDKLCYVDDATMYSDFPVNGEIAYTKQNEIETTEQPIREILKKESVPEEIKNKLDPKSEDRVFRNNADDVFVSVEKKSTSFEERQVKDVMGVYNESKYEVDDGIIDQESRFTDIGALISNVGNSECIVKSKLFLEDYTSISVSDNFPDTAESLSLLLEEKRLVQKRNDPKKNVAAVISKVNVLKCLEDRVGDNKKENTISGLKPVHKDIVLDGGGRNMLELVNDSGSLTEKSQLVSGSIDVKGVEKKKIKNRDNRDGEPEESKNVTSSDNEDGVIIGSYSISYSNNKTMEDTLLKTKKSFEGYMHDVKHITVLPIIKKNEGGMQLNDCNNGYDDSVEGENFLINLVTDDEKSKRKVCSGILLEIPLAPTPLVEAQSLSQDFPNDTDEDLDAVRLEIEEIMLSDFMDDEYFDYD